MNEFVNQLSTDPALRAEFKSDPKGVLARNGEPVPDGVEVTVVESTPDHIYVVLPPARSADGELSDEELAGAAGGGGIGVTGSLACVDW